MPSTPPLLPDSENSGEAGARRGRLRAIADEYRAPLLLAALALVIAALFAFLPTQQPRADDFSAQTASDQGGFAILPGQASDAPVIGEAIEAADDARAKNAAVPFVSGKIPVAAPFRFAGTPLDLERATECLALAAMAEAGPSDAGQRAVIQVVLNRARHPAFARTVCGVVYQGSERRTGCQFTFTCDGSLTRRYGDEAWRAARVRAAEALRGSVYAPVGTATHYHTDWVFPYWSPKLEKLARVETHLFFRWPGFWGSKAAARMAYNGGEPDTAASSEVLASEAALAEPTALPTIASAAPAISGGELVMRDASGKANFVHIGGGNADEALVLARKLCTAPGTCRVMGWTDRAAIPAKFPVPSGARDTLQFSYARDPSGAEITLYNCDTFKGLPRERCIPKGVLPR